MTSQRIGYIRVSSIRTKYRAPVRRN